MKTLKQHIFEKLTVSKPTYALFPKSKEELEEIIKSEIDKNGNECSLNHINVSKITDMADLFFGSKFNGDISKWGVSNVTNMSGMFQNSIFNGDISDWDVHNVTNMTEMFYRGEFSGDISNWDVSNVKDMFEIFFNSPLENNPPKWFKI